MRIKMKRSHATNLYRAIFGLTLGATLAAAGLCEAQTIDKKTDKAKIAKKTVDEKPLQSYSGIFNSTVVPLELSTTGQAYEMNLWTILAQGWNGIKPRQEKNIRDFIQTKMKLYD